MGLGVGLVGERGLVGEVVFADGRGVGGVGGGGRWAGVGGVGVVGEAAGGFLRGDLKGLERVEGGLRRRRLRGGGGEGMVGGLKACDDWSSL